MRSTTCFYLFAPFHESLTDGGQVAELWQWIMFDLSVFAESFVKEVGNLDDEVLVLSSENSFTHIQLQVLFDEI